MQFMHCPAHVSAVIASLLILVLARSHAMSQSAAPSEEVIADFEAAAVQQLATARNAKAHVVIDASAPRGRSFLRLDLDADAAEQGAYVRLDLKLNSGFADRASLAAMLRAPDAPQRVQLRWLALDARGRPIFQRRFQLDPGEQWIQLDAPLRTWRWDNARVADWDEVRGLALRVESPAKRIELDELRLSGSETDEQRAQWLMDLAFRSHPRAFVLEDGLLVASDAQPALGKAELFRLLHDMRSARGFVRRVFGEAVQATDELGPVTLLIFAGPLDEKAFYERLGEQWQAEIRPPTQGGYSVQDIATSTYRAELGPRRPVYVHESVHAIVARDLRLLTGHQPHTPLQEGIASYVQACVHPRSLSRRDLAAQFVKPIDPAGKGLFKPLAMLFDSPVTTNQYAQLASVVAYLAENDVELLRSLARGLAEGQNATRVLQSRGMSWEELQDAWLAWGQRRFAETSDDSTAPFQLPEEFR